MAGASRGLYRIGIGFERDGGAQLNASGSDTKRRPWVLPHQLRLVRARWRRQLNAVDGSAPGTDNFTACVPAL
jgi:hypothetical protein